MKDPANEIGENVTITDSTQLLSITPEQAKKIKFLRIENQVLDHEFRSFLLLLNKLDSLCFYKCEDKDSILSYVKHSDEVRFLDCALTSKDATWNLSPILNWGYIKFLDLTGNDIGIEPEPFFLWLKKNLWGEVSIDKIILSDNKFTDDNKHKVLLDFEKRGYPQFVI